MTYIVMDLEFNYPETCYRSERNGIRLNEEITDMYLDVKHSTEKQMKIRFVTESIFDR